MSKNLAIPSKGRFKDKSLNKALFRAQTIFAKKRHEYVESHFIRNIIKDLEILNKEEKIEYLRSLENQNIYNIVSYKKRRIEKHFSIGICKVCEKNKSNCQHHIIFIKNGGSNGKNNRLPICNDCHKEIHPWMKRFSNAPSDVDLNIR